MSEVKKLHRLKLGIAAALIGYSVVAVAGNLFAPRGEYFPFFSWSLFSDVPAERSTFELYIVRIDDTAFDEPRNFFDLPEYFEAARRRSSTVSKATKGLGRALLWAPEDVAAVRAVFEEQLVREHAQVEYAIARVAYRPLDRWRTGAFERYEVVGRFVARRGA